MLHSRRAFLAVTAAAVGAAPLSAPAMTAQDQALSQSGIASLFTRLPGEKAFKILAPAADGKPEFLAASNASTMLFVASAIKTFILCEALRQVDSPNVVQTISQRQLALDARVWSTDSATFNPPNLIGMAHCT
ncbi:MAG: hypothetical protein M3178_12120 [Pseudomonadota bacterium]|nr:hypothetical protein [Pseudomonadota bacterium]